jgi:CRP-like cAMP-binding protein
VHRRSVGRDGAERLAKISLFTAVPRGQLRALAELLDEVTAEEGEVVMAEGEQGFELMMIEDGTAEVTQGGERINVMGPGEFFGELSVLGDGQLRTATVTAASEFRGLVFTAHFMRQIHDRLPLVGERMDQMASKHVADDQERERA